jgi:hypothetical protein
MDYSLLILINPKILLPSSRIKLQINIDFSYNLTSKERWKKDSPGSTGSITKREIIKEKEENKDHKINPRNRKKRNRKENLDMKMKMKKFRKKRKK